MAGLSSVQTLILAVVIVLLGSGFQTGYNAAIVNLPQAFIKNWINVTSSVRYNHALSENCVEGIWSVYVTSREIGSVLGAAMAGWLCDRFGRTMVMSVNSVFLLITSIAQGVAPSQGLGYFEIFFSARLFTGFGIGVADVAVIVYLNEIAPIHIRGTLGFGYYLSYTCGAAAAFFVELPSFLGTNGLWPIGFYIPLIFLFIMSIATCSVLPESPRYLLLQCGRKLAAEKAIAFYQGESAVLGVIDELEKEKLALDTQKYVYNCDKNQKRTCSDEQDPLIGSNNDAESKRHTTSKLMIMVEDKTLRLPMVLTLIIIFAKAMSGNVVVMSYSTELLIISGVSSRAAEHVSSFVGCFMVVSALMSLYLVEKVGRRLLVITCSWICATVWLIMCFVPVALDNLCILQIQDKGLCESIRLTILAGCFYVWAAVFSCGLGPCGSAFIAEMWLQRYRATAISLSVTLYFSINILLAVATPNFFVILKQYTLLFFTVPLIGSAIYLSLKCPETKGKTNLQVVNELTE